MQRAGLDPVVVREPGGTPVAEAIRSELLRRDRDWDPRAELLYFSTARADLVHHVIRPALAAGRIVLSDRFSLSTEAYQVGGRGVALEEVRALTQIATGGLRPDLTLVLDLPARMGEARRQQKGRTDDRFEREDGAFHDRVEAYYAGARGEGVVHLDGGQAPERVLRSAWEAARAQDPTRFPAWTG
jgi:dTMP kinase